MQSLGDALWPGRIPPLLDQSILLASSLLLFQCAWLDLSSLLLQFGLSSVSATRSVNKFLLSRPVKCTLVWITLGLFAAKRIESGQLIDEDFLLQLSHFYLLHKFVVMNNKDYKHRKPPMRRADMLVVEQQAAAGAPQGNQHIGLSGAALGSGLRACVDPSLVFEEQAKQVQWIQTGLQNRSIWRGTRVVRPGTYDSDEWLLQEHFRCEGRLCGGMPAIHLGIPSDGPTTASVIIPDSPTALGPEGREGVVSLKVAPNSALSCHSPDVVVEERSLLSDHQREPLRRSKRLAARPVLCQQESDQEHLCQDDIYLVYVIGIITGPDRVTGIAFAEMFINSTTIQRFKSSVEDWR
jgi:hypothetical protein